MNPALIEGHRSLCVMGLGTVLQHHCDWLHERFGIRYASDNDPSRTHPGVPCIRPAALAGLDDPFVIVTTSQAHYRQIDRQLEASGVPHCWVGDIPEAEQKAYPAVRLSTLEGPYRDRLGNTIEWDGCHAPDVEVRFGRSGRDGRQPFQARNNRLIIGPGCHLDGRCQIRFMGEGSRVEFGGGNWVGGGMELAVGGNSHFSTGDRCTFESVSVACQDGHIQIGNDCMFSVGINLFQSDSHPIFDVASGRRLNSGRNIGIGDHVWVGLGAMLLAGCEIGPHSIVGARAATSGRFPGNVILAGSPAKIVREGVTWRRDELQCSASLSHISDCRRY